MSAATAPILTTEERQGLTIAFPAAAATVLYAGTLGATDASGRAVPASDSAGLRVVGRVEQTADNSGGSAGAINALIKRGIFLLNNSATNAVDPDDVGKACYVEDDNTVAETSTHKVKAGRVLGLEADGRVWVDTNDAARVPTSVTLGSTNGAAAAAADLAALKAETELLGDDVRAIYAALQAQGILK